MHHQQIFMIHINVLQTKPQASLGLRAEKELKARGFPPT